MLAVAEAVQGAGTGVGVGAAGTGVGCSGTTSVLVGGMGVTVCSMNGPLVAVGPVGDSTDTATEATAETAC